MLIMNQNRDVLFDTTGAMMRIAYRETTEKYVVLGINNGYGSVEISTHDTEEDAKKALLVIQYAETLSYRTVDFGDNVVNDLDLIIKGFKELLGLLEE